MIFYIRYLKKYIPIALLAMLFLSLETAADLALPAMLSIIIDKGVALSDFAMITKIGIVMIGISLLGAIGAVMRNIIASVVSFKIGAKLRRDLYEKLLFMPGKQKDNYDSGTLITRLTNDVYQLQLFLNGIMRIFLKAPLLGIGSVYMSIRLAPSVAFIYLTITPLLFAVVYLNMKIGYPLFSKLQNALDGLNLKLQEFLSGIRVVLSFDRFMHEKKLFGERNDNLTEKGIRSLRIVAIFPALLNLLVYTIVIYIFIKSPSWISSGRMKMGILMALVNYLLQFLFALIMSARIFNVFVRARASATRIRQLLEEDSFSGESTREIHSDVSGLELKNVSFAYGTGNNAVTNVSFSLAKGESLGIIGATGSGKSTLAKLIVGIYEADSGSIGINGIDTAKFSKHELRELVTLAGQKSTLFSTTIKENIVFGKEYDKHRFDAVTEICAVNEFVSHAEKGVDSLVGRGGVNLSGGQKQRISISRALYRKPQILIMDDSTSAIDVITENSIRNGIRDFINDMNLIVISQRIASIAKLDKIIVMKGGKLECIGSHAYLMDHCLAYKEIYDSQMGGEKYEA